MTNDSYLMRGWHVILTVLLPYRPAAILVERSLGEASRGPLLLQPLVNLGFEFHRRLDIVNRHCLAIERINGIVQQVLGDGGSIHKVTARQYHGIVHKGGQDFIQEFVRSIRQESFIGLDRPAGLFDEIGQGAKSRHGFSRE